MATVQLSSWGNTFLVVLDGIFVGLTGHKFEPFLPTLLTNVAHWRLLDIFDPGLITPEAVVGI